MLKPLPSHLLTLAVFLISNYTLLNAQNIIWQKTIGGSDYDQATSVKQTSDGGFIIAGNTSSNISGDKSENNWDTTLTTSDIWIVKLDSVGNIQWENTIGGSKSDAVSEISETNDGGFIISGNSASNTSGDKTEDNCNPTQNMIDYWVIKIDINGNIEWQKRIGGNFNDVLYSIIQTSDGGYLCGGQSKSWNSCDRTAGYDWCGTAGCLAGDYWLVKLDSTGNIQNQKNIDRGNWTTDLLTSISLTTDGGFILGGYSAGPWYVTPNYGGTDFWIIKLDQNLNIQWQKIIGGSSNETGGYITPLSDGNYIVGGSSQSNISGLKTEHTFGGNDYWILKLDSIGDIIWQKSIGGSGNDNFSYIFPTTDGGFICGGNSNSPISGLKTNTNWGGYDQWIVRLDSIGNILWQRTIGGIGEEGLSTITQMNNSNFLVGGHSNSNISGDKTENSKGSFDYWVLELDDQVISDYNIITGKTFFDYNGNNIKDSSDIYLPYKIIKETNTNSFAFSQANGVYNMTVFDTGAFNVIQHNIPYYLITVPSNHTATFTGMDQIDSLNDFATQQTIFINDLQITITPVGAFRPGFNATYNIHYKNVGTTSMQGTVFFYPDTALTFTSSSSTPVSITTDSITWQTPILNPLSHGNIMVTVNIKTTTPIGYWINSTVKIEPVVNDQNPADNISTWTHITTGAIDPNDILVDKDTITTVELSDSPFLDYIIRFQNTGNDTAFTVKILNPIDTFRLELFSLEMISYSHPFELNYIPWERNLEFKFENILLPDSNINEPESHGFVRYRIKPKISLEVHDSITNFAAIYFDYNLPVLTNNAITRIVYPGNYVEVTTTVCDSLVSPSGNFVWTSSGLYVDTIPASGSGVDTIFIVNLTIGTSYSSINTVSCDYYTSPGNNYTWTNSGIYTDTLLNIAGCDSIITVNLTINNSSVTQLTVATCDSLISPSGNYIWSTSGIYNDTITGAEGCDSTLVIDLSILTSSNSVINVTECESYLSPSGNYNWTSNGLYLDTIPNYSGCDSIISINLTILNNSTTQINVFECENYTSPSGIYLWTASGLYNDTLINSSGCDSIISVNLTILSSLTTETKVFVCENYTSPSGNYLWTASGLYNDTLVNSSGCDSIISIDLVIWNNSNSNINVNECFNYTSPSGNHTWNSSGIYTDTISNFNGCDSIITIDLIINLIDTSVTQNSSLLIANESGAVYQWMFCDSTLLPGEVNQSFTAVGNGSYAVIISKNGCTDTSACYLVLIDNINDLYSSDALKVYPNPTEKNISIEYNPNSNDIIELAITDVSGKIKYKSKENNSGNKYNKTIDVSDFSEGLYFIQLNQGDQLIKATFIKQ